LLDVAEQLTRIEQMEADIALKKQSVLLAPRQVFVSYATASAALLAAIFTGIRLFAGR
jgi:hypothetical protein